MGWNQSCFFFLQWKMVFLLCLSLFLWNLLAAVNLLTFLPEISLINIDACTCADGTTIIYLWKYLRTISHLTSESPLIVVLHVSTTSWGYLSHIPVWCQYFFFPLLDLFDLFDWLFLCLIYFEQFSKHKPFAFFLPFMDLCSMLSLWFQKDTCVKKFFRTLTEKNR